MENTTAPNSTPLPAPPITTPVQAKKSNILVLSILLLMAIAISSVLVLSTKTAAPVTTTQIATSAAPKPLFLDIASPKGKVTAVAGEVLVKGKTLPNTTVVAYSDTDETSLESDGNGDFEASVVVGDNGGLLQIIAFSDNGAEKSATFDIEPPENLSYNGEINVLGKETAKGQNKESNSNTKSNSQKSTKIDSQSTTSETTLTSEKKEKIIKEFQNKVEVRKLEKLGPGKLKELTSTGSTESATLTKKQIKQLEAVEATPTAQLKRHAIAGIITTLGDGQITIAHQIHRDRITTVYFSALTAVKMKGVDSATTAGLAMGMRVAVVGTPVDGGLLADRIHVIPGKATGIFQKNPVPTGTATESGKISGTPIPTATASATTVPSVSVTPTETDLTATPPQPTTNVSPTAATTSAGLNQ